MTKKRLHQLYKYYDSKGNLLYIGISNNAVARAAQHRLSSHWYGKARYIEIQNYPSRELSEKAETLAIQSENPRYNIAKKDPNALDCTFQGKNSKASIISVKKEANENLNEALKSESNTKDYLEGRLKFLAKDIDRLRFELDYGEKRRAELERMVAEDLDALKQKKITVSQMLWQIETLDMRMYHKCTLAATASATENRRSFGWGFLSKLFGPKRETIGVSQ